ncbi:MAG: hypothetical protein FJ134_02185 [Deltaproteobacteria bacterium]|nr:hypothetical protein [Deltaproteobacteria bacterium]
MGRRTYKLLTWLGLALTLVLLAGPVQARLWVGAQVGANFPASTDVGLNEPGIFTTFQGVKVEPAVIAGLTIGYDFVREGFLGYNWPDWMKYFSFATDFTFNRFDMREQFVNTVFQGFNVGPSIFPPNAFGPLSNIGTGARVEGTMAVWSFLFIGKYGFFPDAEVPFGRFQPYIGVGPGIMFSSIDGATEFFGFPLGSQSSVDIALVTEAGVRYMALKNVSLDVGFRYRYGSPTYSFTSPITGQTVDLTFDAHQFSAMFRASYHF